MALSLKEAQTELRLVSEMLPKPLEEVLRRFKPDKDMRRILAGYLPVWGKKPLHEFVRGVVSCGDGDEPDVWNADMKPFNLFIVLDNIYRRAK